MRLLTTLLLCTCLSYPLSAQIGGNQIPVDEKQGSDATEIYVGGAVLSSQDFIGSSETQLRALPYFSVSNYKGFDFRPFAVSYELINLQRGDGIWATGFNAGAQASYNFAREEDEGAELSGLGDVGGALLTGGYGTLRLGPVSIRVEGGQDVIDGHGGMQFDASLGTRLPVGNGAITAAITTRWGSDKFNQAYFGISEAQANTSVYGQAEYSSGVFSNGATLLLSYPLNDKWDFTALANHQVYTDSVTESPLLQATGAESATLGLLAVSRKFTFTD